jgi:tetratricopeptide (TPR) repeat protein
VFARAAAQARTDGQRAQARLGMAAALRLLDRHPAALVRLDEAEAVTPGDDHATRAVLEHLRGNVLFTSGELPGCRGAHERALAHARAAESPADVVAALSGLGDAFYLEGRLTRARRSFEACHALARSHGILRMEAAAGMMLSLTCYYANEIDAALAFGYQALQLAERIGDARLDGLTASILTIVLPATGDWQAARAMAERTQASARRLGSERLQAMGIELYAHTLIPEGRQREALPMVRQALTLSRRSDGLAISGPSILAALAAVEPDLAASREAIREGEQMLAGACPIHAHFDLRERAMALGLGRGEWSEVRRHADALEAHLLDEPPARMAVVTEQARLLARLGEQPGDQAAAARLAAVREAARAAGLTLLADWPRGLTVP